MRGRCACSSLTPSPGRFPVANRVAAWIWSQIMGKSKTKTSSTAKAGKDKTDQPATSAKATVEARLLADLPPLTNAERSAFRAQFPEAKCDDFGGRTKSEGVIAEARAHAGTIAKALKKHPAALRRYGLTRFAWFLECIAALDAAREAQLAAEGSASAAKGRAARALATAAETRDDLLDALTTIAQGNPSDLHALETATGSSANAGKLAASLRGLTGLARSWLARPEENARVLAASVGLGTGDVDAAEAAGDALEAASGDKTLEGRTLVKDSPSVNRAEGRVLLELRLVMRVFARVNERNKEVPRLAPGAATRHVLGRKSASGSAAEDDGAKGPEEAAPEKSSGG